MTALPESSTFPVSITQIETTDPVQGGVGGVANRALIELGNRTRYLLDALTALEAAGAGFDPDGDYAGLRARATTAEDVGLGALQNLPLQHDPSVGTAAEYASGAAARALYDLLGGVPSLPTDYQNNRVEVVYEVADATLERSVSYPRYSAGAISGTSNAATALDGGVIGNVMGSYAHIIDQRVGD